MQKELEETAKILPQQGSGIYTSQLLVMSVVDLVSLSNTDNHAASSVNEVQETDTPPGLSTSSNPLSLDTQNVSVNSKKSPKTCFQFKKKGVCHFGNNCRFQHDSTTLTKVTNSAEVGNQNRTDKKSEKTCFLFSKSGNCRFGEKCKFLHLVGPKDTNNDESLEVVTESVDQPSVEKPGEEAKDPPKGKKKPRICRFFKQGSCKKGAACNFRHPERKHDDQKEEEGPLATQGGNQDEDGAEKPTPQKPRMQIQTFLRLSELTDEDLPRLRQTEIQQLKKRFPDALEMENEGDPSIYRVVVHPTDPDWVSEMCGNIEYSKATVN